VAPRSATSGFPATAGPTDNLIGGTAARDGNVFAGGVARSANGDTFQGNLVGVGPSGETSYSGFTGIHLKGENNLIGGLANGAGNGIPGSSNRGILVDQAQGNGIEGNLIGTDIDGVEDLGNAQVA
jgi:hypothetical protein